MKSKSLMLQVKTTRRLD